jgi:proteasome lid subunit RPN8/RPN11
MSLDKAFSGESCDSRLELDDPSVIWRDLDGVYKPTARPLSEFLSTIRLASNLGLDFQQQTPLLVFIEHGCMQAMEAHARADVLNEQAGIVCGHAYVDTSGQPYLAVTSVLPAETANSPVHFRFHPGSWEQLWTRIKDGSAILGWYHSHPGMGVFLSGTDLRTQQLHFAAPWQIAVVLDPVSRETAIFHGAEGRKLPPENLITY